VPYESFIAMLVWSVFFIYLNFVSLVFPHIYIPQGSVETHLLCGGIYNNHIIASRLQSVPVTEF